jgi:uncharacterized OB-fold protein
MATMAFNRALPEIKTDPTNQPFFDGARAGKLLIGKCNDTGKQCLSIAIPQTFC